MPSNFDHSTQQDGYLIPNSKESELINRLAFGNFQLIKSNLSTNITTGSLLKSYKMILKELPLFFELFFQIGRLCIEYKMTSQAIYWLSSAASMWYEHEAAEAKKANAHAYFDSILSQQSKNQQLKMFNQFINNKKTEPMQNEEPLADCFYNLGKAYEKENQTELAHYNYESSLNLYIKFNGNNRHTDRILRLTRRLGVINFKMICKAPEQLLAADTLKTLSKLKKAVRMGDNDIEEKNLERKIFLIRKEIKAKNTSESQQNIESLEKSLASLYENIEV